MTWDDTTAWLLDDPGLLTYKSSPTYIWKLPTSTVLNTEHTDTVVVTHGTVVDQTLCTGLF